MAEEEEEVRPMHSTEEEVVVEVNWTLGREAVVVVEDRDEGSLLYEEEVLVVEVVSTSLLSDPR